MEPNLDTLGDHWAPKSHLKMRPKNKLEKHQAGSAGNGPGAPQEETNPDIRPPEDDLNTPWRAWRHGGGYKIILYYVV